MAKSRVTCFGDFLTIVPLFKSPINFIGKNEIAQNGFKNLATFYLSTFLDFYKISNLNT